MRSVDFVSKGRLKTTPFQTTLLLTGIAFAAEPF